MPKTFYTAFQLRIEHWTLIIEHFFFYGITIAMNSFNTIKSLSPVYLCFFLWCRCLCLCLCLCLSYLPFLPGPSFCAGLIPLWSTFCGSGFVILWPKLKLQIAKPRARNSIIFFIVAKFKIVIGNIAGVYFSIDMPMNQIVVNCSLFTNLRKREDGFNFVLLSLSKDCHFLVTLLALGNGRCAW